MKKRILIISPFFFPEKISTGKYNTHLAKQFVKNGHDVDIYCSHPIYPQWHVVKTSQQINGIRAVRGGAWLKFPSNSLLRRFVLETWFSLFVCKQLLFNHKSYDLVVPVFPPSLFMLLVFVLLNRSARIVGVVHDLQGVYASYRSGTFRRLLYCLIGLIEKRSFMACDHLIFLSKDMQKTAIDTYQLNIGKTSVHYPFVTISSSEEENRLKEIIPDGQLSIVYSGALGEKQAPEKLLELISKLADKHKEAKAYIFSQGPIFERLKNKYKSVNIVFLPLVDEAQLPELLSRSSIQIIPQESGTSGGSLPSKLPNLLASGVKILCITDKDSELVNIMARYYNGIAVETWDMEKLVTSASQLLTSEIKASADDKLLSQFNIDTLISQFESFL